jgi:ABC-type transporter Mla subunit MlaD
MDIPLDKYDFIVGFFVLAGLVAAALLITFLVGPDLFDFGSIEVRTYLPSSYGLKRGVPVSYLQFPVGHVKSVQLADPDSIEKKVCVTFTINERFQGIIRKNFTTSLEQEQLGGILSGNIILSPPEPPGAPGGPVESGDELEYHKLETLFSEITDLSSQFQEVLMPRMDSILVELETFLKRINDPDGNAQQMLSNLREMSEILLDPEGELRVALLRANELMETIADENNNLMKFIRDEQMYEAMNETVMNVRNLSGKGDSILDEAKAAATKANEALTAGRAMMDEAHPKVAEILDSIIELQGKTALLLDDLQVVARRTREATSNLPGLADSVEEQLRQVDEITRAAKQIFLIRWYLDESVIDDPVLLKPLMLYDADKPQPKEMEK